MSDFEELYRRYYKQVYFYLLGLSGSGHLAEEITQETFFKVLRKINTFRGECKVSVWILQIAKNTFYNYCRKMRIEPVGGAEETEVEGIWDDSLESVVVDRDTARRILEVLRGIPEPYREVFRMRVFGELSFGEIGNIHGKTESWARVTYHRAKLMIREEIG